MSTGYHRRVGSVRPSHLMYTAGVGALIDLPNFSVLVRGLDDWNYAAVPDWEAIAEPRLLEKVREVLQEPGVKELRPAPWLDSSDQQVADQARRVGVPVVPFPAWLRCTVCGELAPIETKVFGFENHNPHRPHEARFFHSHCPKKKSGRRPLAVPARFVLACTAGHLDDFPYVRFVHQGGTCPESTSPRLRMDDRGGHLGANVEIRCEVCHQRRNMREVTGQRGAEQLPRCRGRHAHLGEFASTGCKAPTNLLIVGASNQWFAQSLSALAVPEAGARELQAKVRQYWDHLKDLPAREMLPYARANVPQLRQFAKWQDEELWEAIEQHRQSAAAPPSGSTLDLRTPEWEVFSSRTLPEPSDDFALRRVEVTGALASYYAGVLQVERLREVRALVGFTRLDAPDPQDPDLVERAPLSRKRPTWVPASEVRGEGIFLRISEDLLAEWEARVGDSDVLQEHREAYGRFRENRYSHRIAGPFDRMRHWPGPRYYALHTLSHLLIRTIALECGYSAASLGERIYAGTEDHPQAGILIYTAVPDADGTLGGLVTLGEPASLLRITTRALTTALRCSSDPLCAERLPKHPADFLHGAACHICLFVSETTCEKGNRFLDRRFVVPIDDPKWALYPGVRDLAVG